MSSCEEQNIHAFSNVQTVECVDCRDQAILQFALYCGDSNDESVDLRLDQQTMEM